MKRPLLLVTLVAVSLCISHQSLAAAASLSESDRNPRAKIGAFDDPRYLVGLNKAQRRGRDIWFKSTFGGEKFFSLILPHAPFNLPLGFEELLTSDRSARFQTYGVINDPDCKAGDAGTGFQDQCPDPAASGIVGIRKIADGSGKTLIGVTCAACHAGFNPERPPQNPNEPTWYAIHPTIGNQYIQIGKIFSARLSPHDPRYQVFQTWAPGTVDTTAIENDHINNPGIITQFFNLPNRPFFDLTQNSQPLRVHRSGQGGEDDTGCENAALRVFFNIGMCARECMVGHLANGPGGTQTPISQAECAAACPDYQQAKASVSDMCAFMQTTKPPRLQKAPAGNALIDRTVLAEGKQVFERECASCHSNGRYGIRNVLSDDAIHPVKDIGTNSCRALTTNWQAGHIWAEFSSDQYKARPTEGPGFYRDVPLLGLWATAPFLHNNRLGPFSTDYSVKGRVDAYEKSMRLLLNPEQRSRLVLKTTASVTLGSKTLPPGTPVGLFANLNPADPTDNGCPDLNETEGHAFGAELSPTEKYALTEYLKTK